MALVVRILKLVGALLAVVLVAFAIWYPFRSDPVGPLAGRALSGEEAPWPEDWSFSDELFLAAVEVRPEDPHSVTTILFTHEGRLHVPAANAAEKQWPAIALADPRVRVKLGDQVFLGRATRITDEAEREAIFGSAAKKYTRLAEASEEDRARLTSAWVFRIDPR